MHSRGGCDGRGGWRRDATLRVLKGSHRLHAAFADARLSCFRRRHENRTGEGRRKWTGVQSLIGRKSTGGARLRGRGHPVPCRVSGALGQSHCCTGQESVKRVPRTRYVVYTSYLPISTLTPQRAEKKRKCVIQGQACNFTLGRLRKMFSKHPRTYGGPLIVMPHYVNPRLTRLGASLFGWHNSIDACLSLIQKRKERVRFLLPHQKIKKHNTFNKIRGEMFLLSYS